MKVIICKRCGHVSRDEKEANRCSELLCAVEQLAVTINMLPEEIAVTMPQPAWSAYYKVLKLAGVDKDISA